MLTQEDLHCLQTMRDFIRWGASRMNNAGVYFGHGTTNAIDEAAALVIHGLHLPPDLSSEYFSSTLTLAEKHVLWRLFERRIRERKPAAYLTNRAWLMGLTFYVDERVLVPRSPIAELIEQRFAPWLAKPETVETILDLGTGCGCLGIACAYVFPDAMVDLVDISVDALAVAQRNIEEHDLEDQVEAMESDLFNAVNGRRYDLIVTNPPYVSFEEMEQLPAEYRHEPLLALEAGDHGLDLALEILRQAGEYLNDQGLLVMEVGSSQYPLSEAYPEIPFTWVDLKRGGEGVFVMTAEQLREHAKSFY